MAETLLLFVLVAWIVFYALARRWFRNRDIQKTLELFTPGFWENSITIAGRLYPLDQVTELKNVRRRLDMMERRGWIESEYGDSARGYRITPLGLAKREQPSLVQKEV